VRLTYTPGPGAPQQFRYLRHRFEADGDSVDVPDDVGVALMGAHPGDFVRGGKAPLAAPADKMVGGPGAVKEPGDEEAAYEVLPVTADAVVAAYSYKVLGKMCKDHGLSAGGSAKARAERLMAAGVELEVSS